MGQTEGTFQRYEKKYIVNEEKYVLLNHCLKDKFMVDNYGETTICNIYFDTPNHLLIRNSVEKPIYKEKLRLRSYGTPSEGDPAYVELKKKYKGIVYKRRVKMELTEAEQYLYYRKPAEKPTQITKEIDWFLQFYQEVEPSMYISYQRTALYDLEQNNLRITFDRDIFWREKDLWLEYGSWGTPILEEGERLMEIKIPKVMPVWLAHLLDVLEIYPISFSKYGKGYQASLENTKYEINKGEILYA
ncbi:MAG: molecular chaperone [Firmicutes bacterium]|nr:molecular chaperone [Bacillota bacterium]